MHFKTTFPTSCQKYSPPQRFQGRKIDRNRDPRGYEITTARPFSNWEALRRRVLPKALGPVRLITSQFITKCDNRKDQRISQTHRTAAHDAPGSFLSVLLRSSELPFRANSLSSYDCTRPISYPLFNFLWVFRSYLLYLFCHFVDSNLIFC